MSNEVASPPDARAPGPELTPEAQRLRQLILPNQWATPVAVPAVLAMWWFYRTPTILTIAALVASTALVQRVAVRYTLANRVERGVTALSVAIWLPTLGMAVLAPDVWAITLVFTILSVLLALPFVSSRHVLGLIGVACAILLVGGYFRANPFTTAFPPDTSPLILGAIIAAGSGVGAMLCMFSVWQSNSRLVETVEGLRESERTLERRVDERTADLVESQRELSLARDEALAANRAKSSFLANMSHELRTPLNAIIGYSEMLQEDAEDEGREQAAADLSKIMGAARHQLGLINDVLDLSKVEAGHMDVVSEEFDVRSLVEEIASTVVPLIERRGNRLELGELSDVGRMHSDATKLRQVLLNLLSNAAKFTENGRIGVRCERQLADGREWIDFRVSDTGIGMTEKQLASVFDAFAQAEKTTQRDYGGTGLGLAISRRFCQLLGGDVTAVSELGQGTEFRVRIPRELPGAPDAAERD